MALVDDVRAVVLAAIKDEVQTDPLGRGYAGKTNAQIAALLSNSFANARTGGYPAAPRLTACIMRLANRLIALDATDIQAAKDLP